MSKEKRVRIKIFGLVQGVGMRDYINREASMLGIKGYVKNLPEGSVECIAEAGPEKLEQLINTIKNAPRGKVENVVTEDISTPQENLQGFNIRF